MPVSDSVLTKQVDRLMKLPFSPAGEEKIGLLKEFRRILRANVISDDHCEAVIDYLIDNVQRCPPPAEVRNAAENVKSVEKTHTPPGCEKCEGTGYVHLERLVKPAGTAPHTAEYSTFCECSLGRFYRGGAQWQEEEKRRRGR